MGSLSQAKTLGGVGSILVLLTIVPTVGSALGIVGFILTLVAVKYISDAVADPSIFKNMLISVVLSIVGIAIGAIVVFTSVFSLMGLRGVTSSSAITSSPNFVAAIVSILVGLGLLWVFYLAGAIFLRKSYNSTSAKLNIGMFRTAALIYLIGAALTIVLIGFVLIFVAQILFIVAFFSIPEQTVQPPPAYSGGTTPPPPPISGSKFCFKCGAALTSGATVCPSCGEKQTA